MRLKQNPKIPEGINTSDEHPIKEFLTLLSGVTLAIVILVVVISLLAQILSPLIPFSWEIRLTKNALNLPEVKQTSEHSAAQAAIRELTEELSVHINIDNTDDPIHFSVHLMDDPAPNAFATLGGNIIVTCGLLENITSENSLAMVLAHEMSHVIRRHPIQSISRGATLQLFLAIFAGTQGNSAVQTILGQTGLFTLLTFNRDMEKEADDDAIKILIRKYQHLEDADVLFKAILNPKDHQQWISFFETHPNTRGRIANIQAQARALQHSTTLSTSYSTPSAITPSTTPLDPRITTYLKAMESKEA